LAVEDPKFEDMISIYAAAVITNNHYHQDVINDLNFYNAAIRSPLTKKWDTAIQEEFDPIGQHQVFGDFVELPEGSKALPSHWVYKPKRDGAGSVQQFKAMIVCGGNYQMEGIGYQAIYALTAHFGFNKLILAITAKYVFGIHQLHVCVTFLGVDLEEEVYMHPPQGYFCLLQNGSCYNDPRSKNSRKIVLRLRRSLCGLKQSSYVWCGTFKEFVMLFGFVASRVDREYFVLCDKKDHGIVVAAVILYVDDLLITAKEGLLGRSLIR
jgi:hypothetical protein